MTAQQQKLTFGWAPGAGGRAGAVEVRDPAMTTPGRVQAVSVPHARRWVANQAAETGDVSLIDDPEEVMAQHGLKGTATVPEALPVPEVMIPTSPVNELHPEWLMGRGWVLRGGHSLRSAPTCRPVSLKGIAALIFYLRQVGEVEEADRIRLETKRLCATARRLAPGRVVQSGRPAGQHSGDHDASTGADRYVGGGKRGRPQP